MQKIKFQINFNSQYKRKTKLSEDKENYLHYFHLGRFPKKDINNTSQLKRLMKWTLLKLRISVFTPKKVKIQAIEWEEIFATYVTDRGLDS